MSVVNVKCLIIVTSLQQAQYQTYWVLSETLDTTYLLNAACSLPLLHVCHALLLFVEVKVHPQFYGM